MSFTQMKKALKTDQSTKYNFKHLNNVSHCTGVVLLLLLKIIVSIDIDD